MLGGIYDNAHIETKALFCRSRYAGNLDLRTGVPFWKDAKCGPCLDVNTFDVAYVDDAACILSAPTLRLLH